MLNCKQVNIRLDIAEQMADGEHVLLLYLIKSLEIPRYRLTFR